MHPSPLFAIGQMVHIVPADGSTSVASFVVHKITARSYVADCWTYSYHGKGITADQEHLSSVAAYPVIGGRDMNTERTLDAVVEAQTFIDRARELVEACKQVDAGTLPKQSEALRRASMDLTRALAEMRGAK